MIFPQNTRIVYGMLILLVLFLCQACEKEPATATAPEPEPGYSQETDRLVHSLENILHPLSANPLHWQDDELSFIDSLANVSVFAMGEATHGTGEFFDAKFRVFRYLVEHHGYRVFAMEADMGECMIINEVIQDQEGIELINLSGLMLDTMRLWPWMTREVRDMLFWMSEFNQGRAEEDRIQYVGIDCQSTGYKAILLREYLRASDFPCIRFSDTLLNRLEWESKQHWEDYTGEYYETDLLELQQLRDSMMIYRDVLVAGSDENTFTLYYHMSEVLTQKTENTQEVFLIKYKSDIRDQFMAENVLWYSENLAGRIFVWAHNGHITRQISYGDFTMGCHLREMIPDNYASFGFQFARGTFMAKGIQDMAFTGLDEHSLSIVPDDSSLTWILSRANEDVFHVDMHELQEDQIWRDALEGGLKHIHIGVGFDHILQNCYGPYHPDAFDHLIFIEESTRSSLLFL